MANKTFNTRVISKHDTETNWNKATNFVPLAGEIIIYDQDTNNPQRIKIGDGTTTVINLPFLGLVKSGGDVTISNGTITVNDDSHNHLISNVDGLQTALDNKANTKHVHGFTPSGTITSTFEGTPTTLSKTYKPTGTISSVVTGITTTTVSTSKISNPGTLSSFSYDEEDDLTLIFNPGTLAQYSNNNVIATVTPTKTAPIFTGASITLSIPYTPEGTITSTFTGTAGTTSVDK